MHGTRAGALFRQPRGVRVNRGPEWVPCVRGGFCRLAALGRVMPNSRLKVSTTQGLASVAAFPAPQQASRDRSPAQDQNQNGSGGPAREWAEGNTGLLSGRKPAIGGRTCPDANCVAGSAGTNADEVCRLEWLTIRQRTVPSRAESVSRRFFFGGFADQHLGFSARRLAHALKLYGRTR